MCRMMVAALCASLALAGCAAPAPPAPPAPPDPIVLEIYDVRDLARPDLAAEVRGAVDPAGWREGGSSVTPGDGILVVRAPPGTQDGVRAFLSGLRGK